MAEKGRACNMDVCVDSGLSDYNPARGTDEYSGNKQDKSVTEWSEREKEKKKEE